MKTKAKQPSVPTPNGMPQFITDPADLDFTGSTKSYTGKAGRCCCGCSGRYTEQRAAITRQENRIRRLVAEGHKAEAYVNHVSVEIVTGSTYWGVPTGRLYIVYFD